MKKISVLLIAVLIFFGCANNNEANDQALMDTNKHNVHGMVWHTNLEVAKEIAQKEDKPILLQFTGSDWCKWCVKLDKEVFGKKEFANFVNENMVLVVLDFPRTVSQTPEVKNYNRALMNKYGVRGFPTILLLDKKGEVVRRTGYVPGGPSAYIKHIKEAYGMK